MTELHKAVLAYARGGHPVFPLRGKLPWIAKAAGGRGVHDATTDEAMIIAWWALQPRANIGLAAGGRFWALDVDPRHGGELSLARLEREHGPLPLTPEQTTGSGGRHLLFAPDEQVRNRAGERHGLPPGLDTRAGGGYIVAAPSIHPSTGRPYRWAAGRGLLDVPLAKAPGWLVSAVAPQREWVPSDRPAEACARPSSAYAAAALRGECDAVRSARPGCRNATLNRSAFSLATLVAAGALDLDDVARALADAAFDAGLPPREVERTLASGLGAGLQHAREGVR